MRRLVHLSDLHFGTEVSAVVEALARSVSAFAPHLAVVTGDLTQRAQPQQFIDARSFLERLPCPSLVVPGNHDIAPLYRPFERLLAPYARYRRFLSREIEGSWHDDELTVVGLCSVQPIRWKEGRLSRRQLAVLESNLGGSPRALRILAAHHPVAHPGKGAHHRHRGDALLAALEASDVAVCLSGHLHASFSGLALTRLGERKSVLAIHASTATSHRLRGEANGYNRMTIDGPFLLIEAMGWDGQAFACVASACYLRKDRVWRRHDGSQAHADA